ncbi:MAG TPA: 50S ribosomal protein L18 [Candidatus Saccharimonadales bacterium]|nr:50S ribosomal protein L18 [Candidatus Saccharimonadales bacterium]
MNKLAKKLHNRLQRKGRIRATISGSAQRPRLSVHVSNLHITAQLVDDDAQRTIAYASTIGSKAAGTMTEKATAIGAEIAKKAKAAKITQVVFDRGGKIYHGRVKALADAARNAGLEF